MAGRPPMLGVFAARTGFASKNKLENTAAPSERPMLDEGFISDSIDEVASARLVYTLLTGRRRCSSRPTLGSTRNGGNRLASFRNVMRKSRGTCGFRGVSY